MIAILFHMSIKSFASFHFSNFHTKMAKKQQGGFGVPSRMSLSSDYILYRDNLHLDHFIRKHVLNAERYIDPSPCSLFTQSIPEVKELVRVTIEQAN